MEEKSEITAISNKYKDALNNLIDSSDTEFPNYLDSPNWLGLIDKESWNTSKSRNSSSTFLEEDCLNEDILILSFMPAPKIRDYQVHQCHDIAILGAKSGKT